MFVVIGQYKTAGEIEAALSGMNSLIREYNASADAKLDLAYGYAIRDTVENNTYELFNKANKAMYRSKRKAHRSFDMHFCC